jgi:hypothetical protein
LQFADSKLSFSTGEVLSYLNPGDMVIPHIKKLLPAETQRQDTSRVTSSEHYSSPRAAISTHDGNLNKFQPAILSGNSTVDRDFGKLYQIYQQDIS